MALEGEGQEAEEGQEGVAGLQLASNVGLERAHKRRLRRISSCQQGGKSPVKMGRNA